MQTYETLTLSVTEIINQVLEESAIRFNSSPNRLTAHEKLSVIREMDNRGVFLAKGSVMEVAEKLCDRLAIINAGKIMFEGSLQELREKRGENASLEKLFLELVDDKPSFNLGNGEA